MRVSRAPMEEDIKGPHGCMGYAREKFHLRGEGRIEYHTAQIGGKQAHHGESQSCAIGATFQVHLLIPQGLNEIMHIGSIFERREGVQVDARLHLAVMTGVEVLVVPAAEGG